jgi:anti-sigma28 factor (negative regulator of flagellin synthesis)
VDVQCARLGRTRHLSEWFGNPHPYARRDKIAHLRQAVENGDYCVSPEQISEKMVREALVAMFAS